MFTQDAAEVEEEEAEEAALIQDALDGADEIVEEEAAAPVPDEIVEELEEEPVPEEAGELEPIPEDVAPMDTEVGAAPEVVTTPAVAADVEADVETAAPTVDFSTIIRSLPKKPDTALYSRIKDQYGEETLPMAQAALKEATAKHRTTAAIRAFLAWLEQE